MKKQVSLTLEEGLWRTFRSQCIARSTSGSQEMSSFMQAKLKQWGVEIAPEKPAPKKKARAA